MSQIHVCEELNFRHMSRSTEEILLTETKHSKKQRNIGKYNHTFAV